MNKPYFIWYKKPKDTEWQKYSYEFTEPVWANHQADQFRSSVKQDEPILYRVSQDEPE